MRKYFNIGDWVETQYVTHGLTNINGEPVDVMINKGERGQIMAYSTDRHWVVFEAWKDWAVVPTEALKKLRKELPSEERLTSVEKRVD